MISPERKRVEILLRRKRRILLCLRAALTEVPENRARISHWQGVVLKHYNLTLKGDKYVEEETCPNK